MDKLPNFASLWWWWWSNNSIFNKMRTEWERRDRWYSFCTNTATGVINLAYQWKLWNLHTISEQSNSISFSISMERDRVKRVNETNNNTIGRSLEAPIISRSTNGINTIDIFLFETKRKNWRQNNHLYASSDVNRNKRTRKIKK